VNKPRIRTKRAMIYDIWSAIKKRCYKAENKSYKYYGGRGIKMCDEWLLSFENFYDWSLDKRYKEGLSIERKDVNGNYEPSNCEWIPKNEQAKNQRSNHNITIKGVTNTISEWSRISGVSRLTIHSRISRGYKGEELLQPPIQNKKETEYFTYNNREMTLRQIGELVGCTKNALRKHVNSGLTLEQSVEKVLRNKCKKAKRSQN
jgi:hypothetical protein